MKRVADISPLLFAIFLSLCWPSLVASTASDQQPVKSLSTLTVDFLGHKGESDVWQVGRLVIELPKTWKQLQGHSTTGFEAPTKSNVVFVGLQATAAAKQSGYSLLRDPHRGPQAFVNRASSDPSFEDCARSTIKYRTKSFDSPERRLVYMECEIARVDREKLVYLNAAVYSNDYMLFFAATGSKLEVAAILSSLSSHEWKD